MLDNKQLKNEWNLSLLYSGDHDPKMEIDLARAEEESYKFIGKWKERTDYLEDPSVMVEALNEFDAWSRDYGITGNLGYYLGLRSAQDETNTEIKARINKLHDHSVKIFNAIQFFELNIAKIPETKQAQFLEFGGLQEFKHFLERTFVEGKHTLSEPEERIMNFKGKTSFSNWVQMLSEFLSKEELLVLDEDGKKCKKLFSETFTLLSSTDKKVRKKAALELEKIFNKYLAVAEHEFNTVCENKKVDDQIRGFSRPDEQRHLADDVESNVVDKLVETVTAHFDISKKYYKFKAELLGQKTLNYYERNVEYGNVSKKYPYEDAVAIVFEVLHKLDPEFSQIFSKFVENGHLDVFPRKGKSGGAFCTCEDILSPTYILLNHTDKLNDVLTIAHEVGHGINDELIKKSQKNLNFGTPLSTAEVASTFMEDFVLAKLLETATEEEKLAIRMMRLDSDVASIFRQIAFYNFETELHQKFREEGYLTKEAIGQLFQKHMQSYLGSAAKGANNWWIYVDHFRSYFYVYSYANGLLISKTLQKRVKENPEFITKVKEFLTAGVTDTPKNIFNRMGIDIADTAFWENGLQEISHYLEETIALAKKLKKLPIKNL